MRYLFLLLLLSVVVRVLLTCSDLNTLKCSFTTEIPDLAVLRSIREYSSDKISTYLPSPHRELVLGMVLGIDELREVPGFKSTLIYTGTIHVVVVSGYNIALVMGSVRKILRINSPLVGKLAALVVSLVYGLLTGFDPPVMRAWFMAAFVTVVGEDTGVRRGGVLDQIVPLLISAELIVLMSPQIIQSLSFQLSFLATLGLVMFSKPVELRLESSRLRTFPFREDFSTSLGASLLVWPLVSFHFGRVALLSPFINMIVLWLVPKITVLGFVFVLVSVLPIVPYLVSKVLVVYADAFIELLNLAELVPFITVDFTISLGVLTLYYALVGATYLIIYVKDKGLVR